MKLDFYAYLLGHSDFPLTKSDHDRVDRFKLFDVDENRAMYFGEHDNYLYVCVLDKTKIGDVLACEWYSFCKYRDDIKQWQYMNHGQLLSKKRKHMLPAVAELTDLWEKYNET